MGGWVFSALNVANDCFEFYLWMNKIYKTYSSVDNKTVCHKPNYM